MIDSSKVVHFILLSPEGGGTGSYLYSMMGSELATCTGVTTTVFPDVQYLEKLESLPRPDLVILFGSFCKSRTDIYSLVFRIRSSWETRIAAWVTTDPYEFDYNLSLPGLADFIFTNDYSSCKYYQYHQAYHLPPATFNRIDLSNNLDNAETDLDLLVYGIEHSDSIQILDELQDVIKPYSTLVIGSNFPESIGANFSYQSVGSHAELISIIRRSRIVLNLSSCINLCNCIYEIVPSTPHPSIFELAALKVCQLVFFRQFEIYSYFTKDEIITFSYKSEFAELLQRYSQNSQLRYSQADQAWQRVVQDHLYRHRLQKLISYIANQDDENFNIQF